LIFSKEIKDLHGEPTSPAKQLKTNNYIFSNKIKHLQHTVNPPANLLILHYNKKPNNYNDLHTIVEVYYKTLNTIEKIHYSRTFNLINGLYTIVEVELYSVTSCEH